MQKTIIYAVVAALVLVSVAVVAATSYLPTDIIEPGDKIDDVHQSQQQQPTSSPITPNMLDGDDSVKVMDVQQDSSAFCGSGDAMHTTYIREFVIPTHCTSPLAITLDNEGDIWFAQTSTGSLAEFDPTTEAFIEYSNPLWPKNTEVARSMIWGLDYSPDEYMWFTDEVFDSVWRYSINNEKYERFDYPSTGNSLPQRLQIDDTQAANTGTITIIINDLTGSKLTFLDPSRAANAEQGISYFSIPSPVEGSVTGSFAIDSSEANSGDVWFTNWVHRQGGVLIKFDKSWYTESVAKSGMQYLPLVDFVDAYPMPPELLAPNGIEVSKDGIVWIADTSSSSFFSFDPVTEQFVQYPTAEPQQSTYGNHTGIVKSPISRPYWIDSDQHGRLVLNAHAANNISVIDPREQSIVEYHIPSKNPAWGDCIQASGGDDMNQADCGLAQVFDFVVRDHEIWFTEWVENKIGVADISVELPIKVQPEQDSILIEAGTSQQISLAIEESTQDGLVKESYLILSATHEFLDVRLISDGDDNYDDGILTDTGSSMTPRTVTVEVSVEEEDSGDGGSGGTNAIPGTYKILLGVQMPDIAIGKFVTVTVP